MGTLAELPNLKVSLNFCFASPIRQKCPLTELIEKLLYHEDNVKKGPPIKKYDSNILSNLKFLIFFKLLEDIVKDIWQEINKKSV